MEPKENEPEKSEITSFNDYMKGYLMNALEKTSDSQKPGSENFSKATRRYVLLTVPLEKSIPLLSDADRLIKWIYDVDKRDRSMKNIPREVRGEMDLSTVSGILWVLGKRNRARVQPPAFFRVYGKWTRIEGKQCILTKEAITLPMFDLSEVSGTIEGIRWITVFADRVEYMITVFQEPFNVMDIPDPVYDGEPDQNTD